MEELEKAAIVAALLDALATDENRVPLEQGWAWRSLATNGLDSARWHPQSDEAFRLAGRVARFRSRKPGRW